MTNAAPLPSEAEQFYEGALRRIPRFLFYIGVMAVPIAGVLFGLAVALGLAVGATIAWVNFRILVQSVDALGERLVSGAASRSGFGVVVRFLLRYAVIIAVSYAIFRVSTAALYGLLAGLCLPVPALVCEAGYELYVALRRGL
jgi:hypothetical protein